jgi:hypothetical protein
MALGISVQVNTNAEQPILPQESHTADQEQIAVLGLSSPSL